MLGLAQFRCSHHDDAIARRAEEGYCTWGNAIEFGVVWVMSSSDASYMGAMSTSIHHNGKHISLVVDVQCKVA